MIPRDGYYMKMAVRRGRNVRGILKPTISFMQKQKPTNNAFIMSPGFPTMSPNVPS